MGICMYIMVGVPGSGKSTYATELGLKENAVIISSDEYRSAILGDASNQSNGDLIFSTMRKDAKSLLESGKNVIIDATNINEKSRNPFIDIAKKVHDCKVVAVVVNTDIEDCIVRDSNRSRVVGKEVILKFVKKFKSPRIEEGFDNIIYVNDCTSGDTFNVLDMMDGFDQNNHHHKYTLDVHTQNVCSNYKIGTDEYYAALYHDVGKLFTKEDDENGESHYFAHANVSSYWLCTHKNLIPPENNFSRILFYIENHMTIRDIMTNQNKINKLKEVYGDYVIDTLIEFCNNDTIATGMKG